MRSGFLVVGVMLTLAFSGCAGASDDGAGASVENPGAEPGGGGAAGTPAGDDGASPTPEATDPDLKFHTHDAWGDRNRYVLFDGALQLGQDLQAESYTGPNGLVVGQREFNPEDDGDDDFTGDKKDIVPQGTAEIVFSFTWTESSIPGLKFYFKTANGPDYLEFGPVESGAEYTIGMQPKWADMPHRDSVSRWRFLIEAFDPAQGNSPIAAHVARGTVEVKMEIVRGDDSYIDPPHPFFYTESDTRSGGEINGTVTGALVLTVGENTVPFGSPMTRLKPPPPNIVPWETTVVRVWLDYTYTGPASAVTHALGLRYHGAESLAYQTPEPMEADAVSAYYEIAVDGTMTDSPYAFETDWEYALYPITAGQADQGDFQGSFHIRIETVKQ